MKKWESGKRRDLGEYAQNILYTCRKLSKNKKLTSEEHNN